MNGWNQEKYQLMLWTQNNLQASMFFVLFCFILFYSHNGIKHCSLKVVFHGKIMSPISFLFIHYVGETTFSLSKVSGKGVAKTIVGWLTCMCCLLCKILVFFVSNFSVIHNTKQVVLLKSRHRKNLFTATFILNKFNSVA